MFKMRAKSNAGPAKPSRVTCFVVISPDYDVILSIDRNLSEYVDERTRYAGLRVSSSNCWRAWITEPIVSRTWNSMGGKSNSGPSNATAWAQAPAFPRILRYLNPIFLGNSIGAP
jgi:hypothetical protein